MAIRVAIVGAGGAGLCALRHLTAQTSTWLVVGDRGDCKSECVQYEATCFEQSSKVGGTWAYTDQVGNDEHGNPIHSSMYKNLRTNLPKECMAFPDFPFSSNLPSFIRHEDVQDYLEDYAKQFDVLKYIKFEQRVKMIRPVLDKQAQFGVRWEIVTCSVVKPNDEGDVQIYDAVIIGNGNYSVPCYPDLVGQDSFMGELLHSHNYRFPEPYKDKTVVLLGANSSGQDIAVEVASVASKVYLSHSKPNLKSKLPDNMHQKPGIARLESPSRVVFLDGSCVDADAVILCTGYHYDYSFLSPECGVRVDDFRVTPLYKHLVNIDHPSMIIIGICKRIVPFPFFDIQIRFFKAILEGRFKLPSKAAMAEDTETDYRSRLDAGNPHRYSHLMSAHHFSYLRELADLANLESLPEYYENVYNWAASIRHTNLMHYKKSNIKLDTMGGTFEILTKDS